MHALVLGASLRALGAEATALAASLIALLIVRDGAEPGGRYPPTIRWL